MKLFMGVFFGVTAFAVLSTDALGRPAQPASFCAPQSDGSCVTVQQFGDEHYHYTTTMDGYLVVEDSTGDLVYADSAAVATTVKAKNADRRSDSEKKFLKRLDQRRVLEKHKSKNVDRFPAQENLLMEEFHHRVKENRKALFRPELVGNWTGECHFPVFLVSTTDRTFGDAKWYERSLNETGFSEDEHFGSVRDYFLVSSDSIFKPVFDVFEVKVGLVADLSTSPQDKEGTFVKAVIDAAVPSMGDLSKFDKDGDKIIDGFAVIIPGTESGTNLWGHMYWYMVYTNPELYGGGYGGWGGYGGGRNTNSWNNNYNGYKFNRYLAVAENADETMYSAVGHNGIGVFIHEFSHVLGLPDFYSQLDGADSFIEGPTPYDIMTQGMYNGVSSRTLLQGRRPPKYSAFERESMGWMSIPEIKPTDDIYSLEMIDANKAYGVTNPNNNDEYYVVEYRPRIGWDAGISERNSMGVLVWYINYDAKAWEYFPNQERNNPRYKLENVINVSSNRGEKSFSGFKFGDVGVYNVITEENERVCFAANANASVKCLPYSSSSVASSSSVSAPSSSNASISVDEPPVSDGKSSSSKHVKRSSSSSVGLMHGISSAVILAVVSSSSGAESSSDMKTGLYTGYGKVVALGVQNSEIVVRSMELGLKTVRFVDALGNEVKATEFSSGELHVPFAELSRRGVFMVQVFVGGKLAQTHKIVVK